MRRPASPAQVFPRKFNLVDVEIRRYSIFPSAMPIAEGLSRREVRLVLLLAAGDYNLGHAEVATPELPPRESAAMGISLDSQIVRDKLTSLFKVGHDKVDIIQKLHAEHEARNSDWKEYGPVLMHHADDGAKLVRFEFNNQFEAKGDNDEQRVEERLRYIESFLASMVGPDEEYHLTFEERPVVGDGETGNIVNYFVRGVIVPKQSA